MSVPRKYQHLPTTTPAGGVEEVARAMANIAVVATMKRRASRLVMFDPGGFPWNKREVMVEAVYSKSTVFLGRTKMQILTVRSSFG